jgi:hypothetical protein
MAVVYVGSFPFDPKTELKNFERKQAEFEAAYRRTEDPLILYEALRHVQAARQMPPDWLMEACGDSILRDRTDQTAERFKERMRHVQRYRCVRNLRLEKHTKDRALDLAVDRLEPKGERAARSTIEESYNRVSRDLKRAGRDSEYFLLVARSDPTVVPISQTQTRKITGFTRGDR